MSRTVAIPHRAYLMLLIDPRWPEPKVVDARIMSDDNPTSRSGCRWANLAGCEGEGRDFEEAYQRVKKLVRTAPHLKWVRKIMAQAEARSRIYMEARLAPTRRARIVARRA